MWIAGTFLLVAGFLLCVSIAWAALGFLMMGLGLICLLIAERRKTRTAGFAALESDETEARQVPRPDPAQEIVELAEPALRSDKAVMRHEPSLYPEKGNAQPAGSGLSPSNTADPRREPSLFRERNNAQPVPSSELRSGRSESRRKRSLAPEANEPKLAIVSREQRADSRQRTIGPHSQDSEEWLALVKSDPDIARSVAALEPFGKKYVDELARSYLALNDKDYLPVILKKIASTVKKDFGKDVASTAAIEGNPDVDLISFALSKARGLRVEQVLDERTSHDVVTRRPVAVNHAPQVKPDTRQRQAVVRSVKTSGEAPEHGTGAAGDHEVEAAPAPAAAGTKITTIVPAARNAAPVLDDAENLAELFNRLDPRTSVKN